MRIECLACVAASFLFVSGGALALDAATPGAAPAGEAQEDAGARSAKSIECSQKADAQNLHGKPRKRFMHECKHGA